MEPSMATMSDASKVMLLVCVENVSVVFDGFKALDIEIFGIRHNELRVVIGPNGAGKTTLCDVLSGKTRPVGGRVWVRGHDVTRMSEADIVRLGVGRKFQTPALFENLTVYENMGLALPRRRNLWQNLWGHTTKEEEDRIASVLNRVNLSHSWDTPAKYLSHGARQTLEISMLILTSPELLLVDEPAAGLTDAEAELMADLLLDLQGRHGIIVIEHDMDFVRRLNAKVTVLNEGAILAEGSMDEIQSNQDVIDVYLGR